MFALKKKSNKLILKKSKKMEEFQEHDRIRVSKETRNELNQTYTDLKILGKVFKRRQIYLEDLKNSKQTTTKLVAYVSEKTMRDLFGRTDLGEIAVEATEAPETLLVGCDPEFILLSKKNNNYLYASNFLSFDSSFGSDGPCAEIRPGIFNKVEDLVLKIKDIIEYGQNNFGDTLEFVGGSSYIEEQPSTQYANRENYLVPIGGHVSLGRSRELKEHNLVDFYIILRAFLDATIGFPFYFIEKPTPHIRRRTSPAYGLMGSAKIDGKRFEWRVPGGFWLTHPEIAEIFLNITYHTTKAIYNIHADLGHQCDKTKELIDTLFFKKQKGEKLLAQAEKALNSRVEEYKENYKNTVKTAIYYIKILHRLSGIYNETIDYIESFEDMIRYSYSPKSLSLPDNWLAQTKLDKGKNWI